MEVAFKLGPSDFKIHLLIHIGGWSQDAIFIYRGKCFMGLVLADVLQHFLYFLLLKAHYVRWL